VQKVYWDPALLAIEELPGPAQSDSEIVSAVQNAIEQLPTAQREIITARFYEGLTLDQIGARLGLTRKGVLAQNYAAIRSLKYQLSSFVKAKWGIEVSGLCRICRHPKRSEIEKMLLSKSKHETWGAFGKRLKREIGERIHPPRILISHLGHLKGGGNDASRS